MSSALAGIKVVEAASYVTGPFAAQLLADMGAEVVKVNTPTLHYSITPGSFTCVIRV